jgi:hypothetical protein
MRICKIDANDVALIERQISIRKSRLENLRLLEKGEKLSELEKTPSSLRWHQSRREELKHEVTILGQSADALIKHLRQKQRQ